MTHAVEAQLSKLGIVLPQAPAPVANYLPYVISGNLVFVAGQAAIIDGKHPYVGRLGAELSVADGQAAARVAAINVLAQVKAACSGEWHRVVRCVQLHGYINATAEFAEHPAVLDGASNLLVEVLGDVASMCVLPSARFPCVVVRPWCSTLYLNCGTCRQVEAVIAGFALTGRQPLQHDALCQHALTYEYSQEISIFRSFWLVFLN